jgi:hypothetical protein
MDQTALDELAELIFGDGAYELVRKMNPTQTDLAAKKKREKRQAQVGLASNIIGLGAGIAGTAEAHQKFKTVRAERGTKGFKVKGGKLSTAMPEGLKGAAQAAGKVAGKIRTKHVVGLAGAGLGLQVANVAGDAVANRVLARSAKDEPKKVRKRDEFYTSKEAAAHLSKGKLYMVAGQGAKKAAPKVKEAALATKEQLKKSDEIVWEGEFSKFDMDKRQVFGWASVVEINGEPVIDRQGDYIEAEEIEKAAYNYVVKSRKGGDMHRREHHEEGERPFHASDMIESFMVTPEKLEKMGLPAGSLPTGWWVGYQVNDEATWDLVKKGHRTGFSIHGKGKRKDL